MMCSTCQHGMSPHDVNTGCQHRMCPAKDVQHRMSAKDVSSTGCQAYDVSAKDVAAHDVSTGCHRSMSSQDATR